MKLFKTLYILRLWLELISFWIVHILLIPARIRIITSRSSDEFLSYQDLCLLNNNYRTTEKLSIEQEISYQEKWAERVSSIAEFFDFK